MMAYRVIMLMLAFTNKYSFCFCASSPLMLVDNTFFPNSNCTWLSIGDPVSILGCSRGCSARTGCLGIGFKAGISGCVLIDPIATDVCHELAVEMTGNMDNWITYARVTGKETCIEYLVSSVPDSQITASSIFGGNPNLDVNPNRARLNSNRTITDAGLQKIGGWLINTNDDVDRWIQIEFNNTVVIRGIATQGTWNDPNSPVDIFDQRVTKYEILHSLDCVIWTTVTDLSGQNREFVGNAVVHGGNIIQTNLLDIPFVTKCVRLHILEWDAANVGLNMLTGLRLDFLGCDYN